jgi:hypothetical protein
MLLCLAISTSSTDGKLTQDRAPPNSSTPRRENVNPGSMRIWSILEPGNGFQHGKVEKMSNENSEVRFPQDEMIIMEIAKVFSWIRWSQSPIRRVRRHCQGKWNRFRWGGAWDDPHGDRNWGLNDDHELRRSSGKISKLDDDSPHCSTFYMVNITIHPWMSKKWSDPSFH